MDQWSYDPAHDLGLSMRERQQSLRREVGLASTASGLAWRGLMRAYLAVGHRLAVAGRENLPARPPYLLVANHASHLDALVLASAVPLRHVGHVFPIAAGDTFFTSTATSLFATACINALPLWRENCGAHTLDDLRDRLVSEDCIFILFPEGTRSRSGEMARFRPGLGHLVAGTDVPVVPCGLDGTWRAFPPSRSVPRPTRVRLTVGEPLTFADVPDEREGWVEVASQTEAAVRALVPPA